MPSRPKRLVTAREDRREDGLPTVEVAQVVEIVGMREGAAVAVSRPSSAGPSWSCRGKLGAPASRIVPLDRQDVSGWLYDLMAAQRRCTCAPPSSLSSIRARLGGLKVQWNSEQLRCPLAEKGSFPKGTLATQGTHNADADPDTAANTA